MPGAAISLSPVSSGCARCRVCRCFGYPAALGLDPLVLLRFPEFSSANIRRLVYLRATVSILVPLWVAYFAYLPAHTVLEFS